MPFGENLSILVLGFLACFSLSRLRQISLSLVCCRTDYNHICWTAMHTWDFPFDLFLQDLGLLARVLQVVECNL